MPDNKNDNKNKNEYSIGYNGEFFSDFPDFDSMPAEKSGKPKTKAKPVENNEYAEYADYSDKEVSFETDEKSDNDEALSKTSEKGKDTKKKSPLFAIICAVLVVAIIACSTLSVFGINKFFNSSNGDALIQTSGNYYNVYTQIFAKYKSTKYPAGIIKELSKAYTVNNDVVGWLYIEGTNVNTPIVQSDDNNYYLRYNFYKSYTNYGTPYADYRCKVDELSKNTVIFGHNMPSGTHFYDVNRYEDIEWYKKNPVITYSTLFGSYTFLIYTAFYSTVDSKDDGGYIFNYIYPNMADSNFKGYIEQVNQRALYTTNVDLKASDKIITLSTCNHTYDTLCNQKVDSRLVVVGRLLRSGEDANVNTNTAKSNDNYRKPQVWYSKHNKTNPYANSRSWYPSSK